MAQVEVSAMKGSGDAQRVINNASAMLVIGYRVWVTWGGEWNEEDGVTVSNFGILFFFPTMNRGNRKRRLSLILWPLESNALRLPSRPWVK